MTGSIPLLTLYDFMASTDQHCLFLTVIIWKFVMNASENGPHTMKSGFGIAFKKTLESYLFFSNSHYMQL